jgi:mannose-6-phosphate isomerase
MTAAETTPCLIPITGQIQHYAWGGYRFIPDLLGQSNSSSTPYAELWLGAHPKSPSIARVSNRDIQLDHLLSTAAETWLGPHVSRTFDRRLPYLMKILDAKDMLSIQVHPSKSQAEAGFAREEKQHIPLDAPTRNYKDNNHKPEVHVALTEFWMLHGFRPLEEIERILNQTPEFKDLYSVFQTGGLPRLYRSVMEMPQSDVDAILTPLLRRLREVPETKRDKNTPDFWAIRADDTFPVAGGGHDRGIFSIFFLNLVYLQPGQGTFQDAGVLHAYLEGTNVELMANSDNVLRGGLTPKHVDVDELLKTVDFTAATPSILEASPLSMTTDLYPTPAADFDLYRITLNAGEDHKSDAEHGPDTLVVLEGEVSVQHSGGTETFGRGDAGFAAANCPYTLSTSKGAVLFKATVPLS